MKLWLGFGIVVSSAIVWVSGLVSVQAERFFFAAICVGCFLGAASAPKSIGQKTLLALISAQLTLALGDTILRLVDGEKSLHRPHDKFFEYSTEYPRSFRYRPLTNYTGSSIGDLSILSGQVDRAVSRPEVFLVDSWGFRNSVGKNLDEVKTLLLGDSFAAGVGVTQEQTLAAKLDVTKFGAVYNLSLPGSPADEVCSLVRYGSKLKLAPDSKLIWLIFPANDLFESYDCLGRLDARPSGSVWARLQAQVYSYQARSPVVRRLMLAAAQMESAPAVREEISTDFGQLLFLDFHNWASQLDSARVRTLPDWSNLKRALSAGIDFAAERKLKLLIGILPTKDEIYSKQKFEGPSGATKAILELCQQMQLDCLDLKIPLWDSAWKNPAKPRLLWWPDDTHWNAEGHAVVAEAFQGQGPLDPKSGL